MKLMSRYSRHAWVDEMSIQLHCYVTQGIPTNSKAIASYIPTVMQLDTKLAFLKTASWKQLCVVMISCVVATSFVHRADIWSNLEEAMITYG